MTDDKVVKDDDKEREESEPQDPESRADPALATEDHPKGSHYILVRDIRIAEDVIVKHVQMPKRNSSVPIRRFSCRSSAWPFSLSFSLSLSICLSVYLSFLESLALR